MATTIQDNRQARQTQDKTRHDTTRHDTTRHDTTRHDKTRQDKTKQQQDKTRQEKTRQTQDKRNARQDIYKTKQDKTRMLTSIRICAKIPGRRCLFRSRQCCDVQDPVSQVKPQRAWKPQCGEVSARFASGSKIHVSSDTHQQQLIKQFKDFGSRLMQTAQHGDVAPFGHFLDDLHHTQGVRRGQPSGRFVQNQKWRAGHQFNANAQTLLFTPWNPAVLLAADAAVHHIPEPKLLGQAFDISISIALFDTCWQA
jgi:hypothetical protein